MSKRLSRTLSARFAKQTSKDDEQDEAFPGVGLDVAAGQRKIKATVALTFHGAQNVPFNSDQDCATM